MASTSSILNGITRNLDESMGVRHLDAEPVLSPVSSPRDIGRRRHREIGTVDIDRVVPAPDQPRCHFSEDGIQRLAKSIRAKGQLLPIHVRWCDEVEKWVIVSGERRWRAAMAAELKTIDCYFHETALPESEIIEQQLVENLLREDLRPIEEARAFASLMSLKNWNGNQVAEALHVPASKVSRSLALLDLPSDVQKQVESGVLAARSAYELTKLPDNQSRRALAEKVANSGMTNKETAETVRRHRGTSRKKRRPGGVKVEFWSENGWKITASSKGKGSYHDVEQALLNALEEVRHRIDNDRQIF